MNMKNPCIIELREKYKNMGFRVMGISEKDDGLHIKLRDNRKGPGICPACGNEVENPNLSRVRTYRDCPLDSGMQVFLHVQRQEMHCKCGKHFTRSHEHLPTRHMTADMTRTIRFFKTNPMLSNRDIGDIFGVSKSYVSSM